MTLPSYKNPPIVEVCCGMKFHPPDKLLIPHIGSFWEKFRADYPIIQHAIPLTSAKGEIMLDPMTGVPLPRIWFINKSDDQLIQFQSDRFYFNWRHRTGDYPRYDSIIKNFESVRNNTKEFFAEFEFGELEPIECELTYINHIPKGQGWETIQDFPKIFYDFIWNQTGRERFLPNPKGIAWQTVFPLDDKGNLTVSLKQGIQVGEKEPVLVLELKARGIGESGSEKSIREWFDLAHEWIVKGFTDLTTPVIQKIWKKE